VANSVTSFAMSGNKQSYQSADGAFVRPDSTFRRFISNEPGAEYLAEKGRYVLYLSPLCPWVRPPISRETARPN